MAKLNAPILSSNDKRTLLSYIKSRLSTNITVASNVRKTKLNFYIYLDLNYM